MISTIRVSSKGQVVIPEEVRTRLNLRAGTQFVVDGDRDVVILKAIAPLPMVTFDRLIRQARVQACKAGFRRSDIAAAIAKVRGRK